MQDHQIKQDHSLLAFCVQWTPPPSPSPYTAFILCASGAFVLCTAVGVILLTHALPHAPLPHALDARAHAALSAAAPPGYEAECDADASVALAIALSAAQLNFLQAHVDL
ncbi:hypothetical protein DFH09DRAFT_1377123 [Mycena vulgaris]|nr:hypothetical protein DFH09DRAFT_1377123 [Mycena vulgaris]